MVQGNHEATYTPKSIVPAYGHTRTPTYAPDTTFRMKYLPKTYKNYGVAYDLA
jgi:hypothetical protein